MSLWSPRLSLGLSLGPRPRPRPYRGIGRATPPRVGGGERASLAGREGALGALAAVRFIDQAKIHLAAGNGGKGCVSFRRAANLPKGGPDGGDGGRGGDIFAVADRSLATLADFQHRPHWKAGAGAAGGSSGKNGRGGEEVALVLPLGTEIWDEEGARKLADLVRHGQRLRLAAGGRGGRGNLAFRSSVDRAPRRSSPPGEGEARSLLLRLRLLADAGLVGLPNAGKSSLLRALSAARPKVAPYPFTTKSPQLGVVDAAGPDGTPVRFVAADVPGLLAGAHEGAGLGFAFSRPLAALPLAAPCRGWGGRRPLPLACRQPWRSCGSRAQSRVLRCLP